MLEKIIEILAAQLSLDTDDITLSADVTGDLGADSLDIVQMAAEFEKTFEIEISDEDIMSVKTVADILEYLERRIGVKNSDVLKSGQLSW